VYGSQTTREEFEPEDIDYYFEYTGSLAVSWWEWREKERESERLRRVFGPDSPTSCDDGA
jgi:glycine betaine/choline ABC-type transport system substrate-binding protein